MVVNETPVYNSANLAMLMINLSQSTDATAARALSGF